MKVLKFRIHEDYFEEFKNICIAEEMNVKKKLNVLVSQDTSPSDIKSYFPEDHSEHLRSMTLKVNEQLFKGVMKNCGFYDFRVRDYMPYLIYKFLLSKK